MMTSVIRRLRSNGKDLGIGKQRSKQIGDVAAWLVLLIGGVIMMLPFLWMISTSLKSLGEIYTFPPRLIPDQILWSNYLEAWQRLPFGRFFVNSVTVSVCVTLGQLFTCSLAGYSFARLRYPGRDVLFMLYLATMMIPFAVVMIPLYVLMRGLHWVDSLAALIVPGFFSAWGTFLMRQFMIGIPRDLEDAGRIDGCSFFRLYWMIILPLSKPVLATLAIFALLGSWNEYLWPLIIINSTDNKTLPLGLAMFQNRQPMRTLWNLLMATATFSVLPILVVFVLGQKYYVRGIMTSGLKGAG
jgi:multiple sugar transport system permease protein